MKCYICLRLKAEGRIETPRDAETIVSGMASCSSHSFYAAAYETLVAVEEARKSLVHWWDKAFELRGDWDRQKQVFADGSKLDEFYWEGQP